MKDIKQTQLDLFKNHSSVGESETPFEEVFDVKPKSKIVSMDGYMERKKIQKHVDWVVRNFKRIGE